MLTNYVKIALRSLLRNRIFSFINIAGFGAGLSCCLVIALFVMDELQYDKFHSKSDRIFRVVSELESNGLPASLAVTPAPWAPLLEADYPQVENSVRLLKDDRSLVGREGQEQNYQRVFFSDAAIFQVFDFGLTKGNSKNALEEPNSAVLTASAARRYFGDQDPIGKTLKIATNIGREFTVTITGMTADVPSQSHFHFDILVSMSSLDDLSELWAFHMFHTYLLLRDAADKTSLEAMLPDFAGNYINNNPKADGRASLSLQPLGDIHLRSNRVGELESNGSMVYIYVLSSIALFILALACFNFMNLSTVRALERGKEVGLRKAAGARQGQLVFQFLGEAMLLVLIASVMALIFTSAALPFLNSVAGKELDISVLVSPFGVAATLAFLLVVAVMTGLYPSFVLTAFKPVEVLKGKFQKSVRGTRLRKTLVTIQSAISIMLIASTLMLYRQLDFLKTKDLGFDKAHTLAISLPRGVYGERVAAFENGLRSHTSVAALSASSSIPSLQIPVNQVRPEGLPDTESRSVEMLFVANDFVNTAGMKLIAGRDFSQDRRSDVEDAFVINEQAVHDFGWRSAQEALGKKIDWVLPDAVIKSGKVIGVIQDINFKPLNYKVQPLVIHMQPNRLRYIYVKLRPGAVDEAIATVENQYRAAFPYQPFEFTFLDQAVQRLYHNEQRLGKIFIYASMLTVVIAALGIFALSLYNARLRVKEVGIRKVLGATVGDILRASSKDFAGLVLLSNLLAWPVAWYAIDKGLETYAYRVEISWLAFACAGLIVFITAIMASAWETIRSALANPAESLRSE